MLELDRRNTDSGSKASVLVVGIGGAGSNVVDRLALEGMDKSLLTVVNTDIQALNSSVAGAKLQIGRDVTRGLGTGGDPELGRDAATESGKEIRQLVSSCDILILCCGLGGGTGSGAAPAIIRAAKDEGSIVMVFATLPFTFEGRRRNEQSLHVLASIEELADAVVCFENDRMGETVSAKAGIHEAFRAADQIISQSIRSVSSFINAKSIIPVSIADLMTALRSSDSRCLFGYGEGSGQSAAHDALSMALKSPLMDRGRMLELASTVVVQITGGMSMKLSEVQILMHELGKHVNGDAQILLGTAVDKSLENSIHLTIISSFPASGAAANSAKSDTRKEPDASPPQSGKKKKKAPAKKEPAENLEKTKKSTEPDNGLTLETETEITPEPETVIIDTETSVKSNDHEEPIGSVDLGQQEELLPASPKPDKKPSKSAVKQESFQFEAVSRGRFEKIEPTIIDGEDLDVPTFMRKDIKLD